MKKLLIRGGAISILLFVGVGLLLTSCEKETRTIYYPIEQVEKREGRHSSIKKHEVEHHIESILNSIGNLIDKYESSVDFINWTIDSIEQYVISYERTIDDTELFNSYLNKIQELRQKLNSKLTEAK